MMWIGLTGGIGTGKSTVATFLRTQGVAVLDADQESRLLMEKDEAGYLAVINKFGLDILDSNKDIDRQALGKIVFSSPQKLSALENLLHPLIQAEIKDKRKSLELRGEPFAVYDIPLLFEKNLEEQFDRILLVTAPLEQRIERLKQREGWSVEHIQSRLKTQLPLEEKVAKSHDVINNNGTLVELAAEVSQWIQKMQQVWPTKD